MSLPFLVAPEAIRDIEETVEWLRERSPELPDRFQAVIEGVVQSNPGSAGDVSACPSRRPASTRQTGILRGQAFALRLTFGRSSGRSASVLSWTGVLGVCILTIVKVRDVIASLEVDGWQLVRTRGSHRQFRHASKPGTVTVAGKPSTDVPAGTLGSIRKQAGLKKS